MQLTLGEPVEGGGIKRSGKDLVSFGVKSLGRQSSVGDDDRKRNALLDTRPDSFWPSSCTTLVCDLG